jgi:hypothetical protein
VFGSSDAELGARGVFSDRFGMWEPVTREQDLEGRNGKARTATRIETTAALVSLIWRRELSPGQGGCRYDRRSAFEHGLALRNAHASDVGTRSAIQLRVHEVQGDYDPVATSPVGSIPRPASHGLDVERRSGIREPIRGHKNEV